jgi:hypothetical protein
MRGVSLDSTPGSIVARGTECILQGVTSGVSETAKEGTAVSQHQDKAMTAGERD